MELDPEDIEVERPHLEGKTYIYDPDEETEYEDEYGEFEDDIVFDPRRRRTKRRKKRYPKLRKVIAKIKRPFRRPKKTLMAKFGYGLIAFLSFWFLGIHGNNTRTKVNRGEWGWFVNPIWQIKDALAILTSGWGVAKNLEYRFNTVVSNPMGISALLSGLITRFIPIKFWGKGMLSKILILVGICTIAGQLLDPSPNGESNPDSYTPPFGIGETSTVSGHDPFKTAFA